MLANLSDCSTRRSLLSRSIRERNSDSLSKDCMAFSVPSNESEKLPTMLPRKSAKDGLTAP